MSRTLFTTVVVVFLLIVGVNVFSSSGGITGLTRRDGGIGCICHGNHQPTPGVSVFFSGPDSASLGQTIIYRIKVVHGPAITGGFNVASFAGVIDTVASDTSVRRQSGELTHRFPKAFVNDTVSWTFKYTAPLTPQYDTLYAVGNSTNNDFQADTSDQWNFSVNFPVRVGIPIGIANIGNTLYEFSLEQNFPNPFNSGTVIGYQLSVGGLVTLKVFDVLGKEVAELVNGEESAGSHKVKFDGRNLPSGVYFYQLSIVNERLSTNYRETRNMVLVK